MNWVIKHLFYLFFNLFLNNFYLCFFLLIQVSLGYFIDKSEIYFDYNNPLYSEDINLVFGFETKSFNALIFKSKSERTSKTIVIEIVNIFIIFFYFQNNLTKKLFIIKKSGFIQATFNDGYGTKSFHKFSKYMVNTKEYHVLLLIVIDNNSTVTLDKLPSDKTIISEKCKSNKCNFIK